MIRRQDEQVSRQPARVAATPQPSAMSPTLDPAAEAKAREILRQQQQAVATPAPELQPAARPAATPAAPAVAATASPAPSPNTDAQYSKELEDRARQALIARAQAGQAASAQPAPAAEPAAGPVTAPVTAPVATDPQVDRVHTQALDKLGQIQAGESAQTQPATKQQRIRALTDLYRADKLTPAEYHQRRAQILAEPN